MIDIVPLQEQHWQSVRRIYLEGIASGDATFETDVGPDWEDWAADHLEAARLVALVGDEVAGWASLSPVSDRCVYAGVAEVSVYVAADHQGEGVGSSLLQCLVEKSEEQGLWTLQAGIFPENEASLHLHENFGFRVVGRRERLGQMNGVWRDVLFLERRSIRVGVE